MSGAEAERRDPGESRYVQGADGTRLHFRAWTVESPRAAILVLHGLFEHSGRYEELAEAMNRADIATFALDHRGHGASGGRRGHVTRFERFIEDTDRFRQQATVGLAADLPVFLLAHSMGGLIALRYLQDRAPGVAGAIISAPWLALADPPSAPMRALAAVLNRVLPILPLPAGLDPELLSHDPERVADYRDDPRVLSTLTPRLHQQVEQATEVVFQRRDRLRLPLLFLLPGADRIIDTGRSMVFAGSLDRPDVTIRVLERYYHETLQEVERGAVMAEIRDWIEARLT